jgi:hypothetical protein
MAGRVASGGNLFAMDIGRRGWAECPSQDVMTADMRLGLSEYHSAPIRRNKNSSAIRLQDAKCL